MSALWVLSYFRGGSSLLALHVRNLRLRWSICVPILAIGPPQGDAARLLRETGAGWVFAHEDHQGLERHLRTLLRAWSAHPATAPPQSRPLLGLTPRPAVIARYSRREQARQLAALLAEEP